jgi:hypothetical protein
MSIMTLNELRSASFPIDHDDRCDHCRKRLTRQFVFWHLGRVNLAFHRKCAEEFGGTLIYDARKAKSIAEGKSPTGGISAALLESLEAGGRERPVAQERLPGAPRRR